MSTKNKIVIVIIATILLTVLAFVWSQIPRKTNKLENTSKAESKDKVVNVEAKINNYIVNTNNNDFEDFKTIYADGRKSDVRNFRFYNSLMKNVPFGDTVAAKELGLIHVATEWNEYDANVASPESAFIEISIPMGSEQQKEWAATGIDSKSTMIGGDVESDRRMKEPAKRYWAVASKMFEQEFANFKKAEGISNRNVDSVTFDFITTDGFYIVQVPKAELESGTSIWSNMFEESKFLNTEMKRVQSESAKEAEKRVEARQLEEAY